MDQPKPARTRVWRSGNDPTSPIHGTVKLTPEQEQQLTAGMLYVNVHTKNNLGGAIRGQLTKAN
jgi:hypothetical protein